MCVCEYTDMCECVHAHASVCMHVYNYTCTNRATASDTQHCATFAYICVGRAAAVVLQADTHMSSQNHSAYDELVFVSNGQLVVFCCIKS